VIICIAEEYSPGHLGSGLLYLLSGPYFLKILLVWGLFPLCLRPLLGGQEYGFRCVYGYPPMCVLPYIRVRKDDYLEA